MGLTTSHGCWHGPYSQFMRWREAVARAAGFPPLRLMENFMSDRTMKFEDGLLWDLFDRGDLPIPWDITTGDRRLIPLLCHSDHDGVIAPSEGAQIADALEELLPKLPPPEEDSEVRSNTQRGIYDGILAATNRFVAGLRQAGEAGEDVVFG